MWRKLLMITMCTLLCTPVFAQLPPLGIQDEGGAETKPVFTIDCQGDAISCSHSGTKGTIQVNATAGTSTAIDLGDDDSNESSGMTEIATTGDTNSVFTEPSADKLLINLGNNWPTSDTADALSANGGNCAAGSYPLGVDASGAVESCTDATTEINSAIATKDECSEITNCVDNAWDALTDMVLTNTYLYVGNVSNDPVGVAMSGDCTITNAGVVTCDHDALNNFVANEHIDWTSDQGATNIHAGNYTDTDTDDQTIDVLSMSGNNLQISLEDDGEATQTVDISTATAVVANTAKVTDDDLGVDEVYGVGWNGDANSPEKDDIYDAFGATPGGELGGTWASPTVDSGIHDDEYVELGDSFSGDITGAYNSTDITESVLQENGADEILGETLGTACTDGQILKANATGGLDCGTDDDVPDAGDFGNATDLDANGALSNDVVAAAEMADADHGDVSWSGGVASVQEVQSGAISQAADIDNDIITHAQIADADQSDTKCIWFEDPTADDDFKSIWANKTANNFLITEIWAESDQTVNFDLQVDDGTPSDVNGTDISPAAGEAEDTSLSGDTTVAAGEELDLAITSVSGTPTWVSICFTGNWVD